VNGRIFYDQALLALDAADEVHVDDLPEVLQRLETREFIFPRETSSFEGSTEYIFGQAMMRDVVLGTLLRRQATLYHRTMASWLADKAEGRVGEFDALVAEHYEQAGDVTLAAQYLGTASQAALALDAVDEVVASLEKAIWLMSDDQYKPQRVGFQIRLGNFLALKGAYEEARVQLEPALETAREIGDRLTEANALGQLGRLVGVWQGDFAAGRAYFEEALPLTRELNDRPALVFILRQMGNISNLYGEYDKAKPYLEESIALARELEDSGSAAAGINSMGEAARFQGDFESAQTYYAEAMTISKEDGNRDNLAMAMVNLADVHLMKKEYQAGFTLGQESLALSQEIGNEYLEAGSLGIVGHAEAGLGQHEMAERRLCQALQMQTDMGNIPEVLAVVVRFAHLQALKGDVEESLTWLGMVLAHPSMSPDLRFLAENVLTEIRKELGDTEIEMALGKGARLDPEKMVADILDDSRS
jgi:tetratricopeptide (TPR) repeat protein